MGELESLYQELSLQRKLRAAGVSASSAALICRPILGLGAGLHYGLAICENGRIVVHHLERCGFSVSDTLVGFSKGNPIRVEMVRELNPQDRLELQCNFQLVVSDFSKYGLVANNCEDVARLLFEGRRYSYQTLIALGFVFIGLWAVAQKAS